jgi:hypothetical protein
MPRHYRNEGQFARHSNDLSSRRIPRFESCHTSQTVPSPPANLAETLKSARNGPVRVRDLLQSVLDFRHTLIDVLQLGAHAIVSTRRLLQLAEQDAPMQSAPIEERKRSRRSVGEAILRRCAPARHPNLLLFWLGTRDFGSLRRFLNLRRWAGCFH